MDKRIQSLRRKAKIYDILGMLSIALVFGSIFYLPLLVLICVLPVFASNATSLQSQADNLEKKQSFI